MSRSSDKYGECAMCGRMQPLTFHHLVPRTTRTNKWFKKKFERAAFDEGVNLCRNCHSFIHKQYSEKHLGRELNTLEKLLNDPVIHRFVQWISKR